MRFEHAFLSVVYSTGQISLGLLLHPYQTMQQLVEDKVFTFMSLLPTLLLALITVGWRFGVVQMVRLVFSCQTSGFFACHYLTFLSNWITFFMILWQVLLLYLLFRFRAAWQKSSMFCQNNSVTAGHAALRSSTDKRDSD